MKSRLAMMRALVAIIALGALGSVRAEEYDPSPPERVSLLPVFFVPQGEDPPTIAQKSRLVKHLEWAQGRFGELLDGRDTFRMARETPSVCRGKHGLPFYKKQPESAAPHFVGEKISPRIAWLGPMEIVGQPPYQIEVKTNSGEAFGSKATNIVHKRILPSQGPNGKFNAGTMWHSTETPTGWVSLDLTFPFPVTLVKLGIHTQHSGQYHAAEGVRIEVEKKGQWRKVVDQPLRDIDAQVSFPPVRGQKWRVHLRAGPTNRVVVRGLRFFNESGEIFPPMVPYDGP